MIASLGSVGVTPEAIPRTGRRGRGERRPLPARVALVERAFTEDLGGDILGAIGAAAIPLGGAPPDQKRSLVLEPQRRPRHVCGRSRNCRSRPFPGMRRPSPGSAPRGVPGDVRAVAHHPRHAPGQCTPPATTRPTERSMQLPPRARLGNLSELPPELVDAVPEGGDSTLRREVEEDHPRDAEEACCAAGAELAATEALEHEERADLVGERVRRPVTGHGLGELHGHADRHRLVLSSEHSPGRLQAPRWSVGSGHRTRSARPAVPRDGDAGIALVGAVRP